MVFLIDHPLVSTALIDELLTAFAQSSSLIAIPSFQDRRGHPMIFAKQLFAELLHAPLEQGAVAVVRKHHAEILHLTVNEPEVLIDIDTPEAYEEHIVGQGRA
jgi:molybdenum cofactor cytidylyltransferase